MSQNKIFAYLLAKVLRTYDLMIIYVSVILSR